jgi:ribbon-helix-helix CopG family protein
MRWAWSATCPDSSAASVCKDRNPLCILTYVTYCTKVTYMEKTQIYLRKEELEALRSAAARSGRSVADLVRDAIRKVVLKPSAAGPIAIWDGKPRRSSVEHDSVHDET